ncbi:MAG TPA: hypothetical protein VL094_09970 [Sphingomonadaceae bacterium]|nr:hypothetical protein [Sphingomonadaceae bacterium]
MNDYIRRACPHAGAAVSISDWKIRKIEPAWAGHGRKRTILTGKNNFARLVLRRIMKHIVTKGPRERSPSRRKTATLAQQRERR